MPLLTEALDYAVRFRSFSTFPGRFGANTGRFGADLGRFRSLFQSFSADLGDKCQRETGDIAYLDVKSTATGLDGLVTLDRILQECLLRRLNDAAQKPHLVDFDLKCASPELQV